MKSALKNASNLAPVWTNADPKQPRATCWKDLPVVSTNPFEEFYDISFYMISETKSIEAYRNVLQELKTALQQIDNSAKTVHSALNLEKAPDRYIALSDAYIKDAASIPKLL